VAFRAFTEILAVSMSRILLDRRRFSLVLLIAVAGCTPAVSSDQSRGGRSAGSATDASSDEVGLKILDYDGLQKLIASKRGKVVVLDVWSTGCPPCMKSFPDLVALQRKIGPDRLACISLSLDYEGSGKPEDVIPAVLEFLRKQQATFDNVLSSEEPEATDKKLGIVSIPAVLVYDTSGTLQKRFVDGSVDTQRPIYEQVEALVKDLLPSP
jgi:thiol-disulfide isomerase/thioredoxin